MFLPNGVALAVHRDDLNHATVSGNKLYKLKPVFRAAAELGCPAIASFGGPYSNHLHALAWACREQGIQSFGLVRGELQAKLTPTLLDCQDWGMALIPVPRRDYRPLIELVHSSAQPCMTQDIEWPADLTLPFANSTPPSFAPNTLIVPEGGSGPAAIDALAEAYKPIFDKPEFADISHVACATGTGATVAGLCKAVPSEVRVLGIQAVAEDQATLDRVKHWLEEEPANLSILPGHLGGFAKAPKELIEFIEEFEHQHNIPLDTVYNGKVIYQLHRLAIEGFFPNGSKVLVIHTGGLQGKRT